MTTPNNVEATLQIRAIKAMQTRVISDQYALMAMHDAVATNPATVELREQYEDTVKTAADHIAALNHVIKRLSASLETPE